MSASSERLLEQIQQLERNIQIAESSGGDALLMKERLKVLREQFVAAKEALNEGKSILKG